MHRPAILQLVLTLEVVPLNLQPSIEFGLCHMYRIDIEKPVIVPYVARFGHASIPIPVVYDTTGQTKRHGQTLAVRSSCRPCSHCSLIPTSGVTAI